ncbi:hypothetical protein GPECTOR_32g514 [Gonium pectorale]|uniref:Uncharacterized protein n=1 Tax=Gonium pectorale TaxID=33097 RepID=A0A150GDH1_GONPE|nr:hypothetical protein GPECTOR_32g514 [Gonium pectorale]|eukprot:KXZ47901.1 hypothetical protein GPECTOR_32g514 [Gonium pectorale]
MATLTSRARACSSRKASFAPRVRLGRPPAASLYLTSGWEQVPCSSPWSGAPAPVRRGPVATRATIIEDAPSLPAAVPARPPLYLLHCHLPNTSGLVQNGTAPDAQMLKLRDELKTMEKVAKKAAWFSTVEASDGEHVLFVTDCAKQAKKYALQQLPGDAAQYTVELPGGRTVVVPLAEVAAALQMTSESDSEDEHEMGTKAGATAPEAACTVDEKAAKKQRKEEKRAAKMEKEKAMGMKEDDSEDESDDEEEMKAKMKEEKKAAKKEKKEKKDTEARKGEEESDSEDDEEETKDKKAAKKEMKLEAKTAGEQARVMEEDSDGSDEESSSSSGSSDEDADDCPTVVPMGATGEAQPAAPAQPMMMDEEESGSESESESESESGSEDDDMKAEGAAAPVDLPLVL